MKQMKRYKMIHIVPLNDLYEHRESMICHCYPRVKYNRNERVITHNAYDTREFYERILGQAQRGKQWISIVNHIAIELDVWIRDFKDIMHLYN